MKYVQNDGFMESLQRLYQKGGLFQKAAKEIQAAWGRAKISESAPLEDVFHGMNLTNHGETRIEHCRKYDLNGFSRLVTIVDNDVCIFLFAGDHDSTDKWLERNKGLSFVATKDKTGIRLNSLRNSNIREQNYITSESDFAEGSLIERLPERYRRKLFDKLDLDIVKLIEEIESITDEERILEIAQLCEDNSQSEAVLDVLLLLREGDEVKAKLRVEAYSSDAKKLSELSTVEVANIVSGDNAVLVKDVDSELFQHFVETASFHKWMLYLHPAQREIANQSFNGPARLLGVSGSGKTCVLIHRAIYLAKKNPDSRVLILTLNSALANLIEELIVASSGTTRPKNLTVNSVWGLCYDLLMTHEPDNYKYFTKSTIVNNPYAETEHIDDIWNEYYNCLNNNEDADVMFEVHRTLLTRGIYPQDYLKQELEYIRSAFAPSEREQYLNMERAGRSIPLEKRYRELVLDGLNGWEKKMNAVGAVDNMGIVTALYKHVSKLQPIYDHVLVDEIQDLGSLELEIVRKITHSGQDDLFLCGDLAQTVHTKYSDFSKSGIDAAGRYLTLNQNYRNSKQILTAAHQVLTKALNEIPITISGIEVMNPDFANFTSPNPLLLTANSVIEELSMALSYASEKKKAYQGSNHKYCISICGYSQKAIEELGEKLKIPVLSGNTDLSGDWLFLSDLEQTKGFEFDLMIVLNCSKDAIPHPNLPDLEAFRELSKLYVALTRAKTELIVSYSGNPSRFILAAEEYFTASAWNNYVTEVDIRISEIPNPAIPILRDEDTWLSFGKSLLRKRDLVGVSQTLQDELLSHVTGSSKTTGNVTLRKTVEWKDFKSFFDDMKIKRNRVQVISDQVWEELTIRFD